MPNEPKNDQFEKWYVYLQAKWEIYSAFIIEWQVSKLQNLNKKTTTTILVWLLVVSGAVLFLASPDANFPIEQYVTIEKGQSLSSISHSLKDVDVVKNAWVLEFVVRVMGGERKVQAGDYSFSKPIGTFAIARRITSGQYGLEPIKITIPEGATVADMAIIFDKRLFKFDDVAFFRKAQKLEGYLYPDTYHLLPNTKEDEVIRVMKDNLEIRLEEFEEDLAESEYTLHEILTLASIIEKEAWKTRDQYLISGVLHNRLDIDMRLQVDATFTYTHNKGTYQITMAELTDEDNPYNTYVHNGLPPGPIAAVGSTAIDAALNPKANNNFFYLADRFGTTYYSRTYEQHLAKKRRYVD